MQRVSWTCLKRVLDSDTGEDIKLTELTILRFSCVEHDDSCQQFKDPRPGAVAMVLEINSSNGEDEKIDYRKERKREGGGGGAANEPELTRDLFPRKPDFRVGGGNEVTGRRWNSGWAWSSSMKTEKKNPVLWYPSYQDLYGIRRAECWKAF